MKAFFLHRHTDKARERAQLSGPPLRAGLLGADQLARHASALATSHRTTMKHRSSPLLAQLDKNELLLREFHEKTLATLTEHHITPATEWLLDNFYLIEEQMQMARLHLPRDYSRELPRLLKGPSKGLPRIYDTVLSLISHVDAQIDMETLEAFIASYQTVAPLQLGELWAVPIDRKSVV